MIAAAALARRRIPRFRAISQGLPQNDLGKFCAVAMMAKAPRIGDAKTRLAPPLSETKAAALSSCFIGYTADNIIAVAYRSDFTAMSPIRPRRPRGPFTTCCRSRSDCCRRDGSASATVCSMRCLEDLLTARYGSVCLANSR